MSSVCILLQKAGGTIKITYDDDSHIPLIFFLCERIVEVLCTLIKNKLNFLFSWTSWGWGVFGHE